MRRVPSCDDQPQMIRLALPALAACIVACSASHPPLVIRDAAPFDAPPESEDGGSCTTERLTASCMYRGYGTTCPVPCAVPPTCTFLASVTWTGEFCCGFPTDSFADCVCEGGTARCRPAFTTAPDRQVPTTYCELCGHDSGPEDADTDAASEDADVDDAGTDA